MSRDCCRGRQCGQWSVSPSLNLTCTPLCSPTSEPFVDAKWSLEMPSYSALYDSPVPCSVVPLELDPVKKKIVKVIVPPMRKCDSPVPCSVVPLERDPVKKKIVKVIVPPMRKSDGQHYVDPMKFNRAYLSEHMALSIPIAKFTAQHKVCSPISPYSMEMPSYVRSQ